MVTRVEQGAVRSWPRYYVTLSVHLPASELENAQFIESAISGAVLVARDIKRLEVAMSK